MNNKYNIGDMVFVPAEIKFVRKSDTGEISYDIQFQRVKNDAILPFLENQIISKIKMGNEEKNKEKEIEKTITKSYVSSELSKNIKPKSSGLAGK